MLKVKAEQNSNKNILPLERYLREHNLGPTADDKQPIVEKAFTNHQGYDTTITESQIESDRTASKNDEQVIEKVLNSAQADGYVTHRADDKDILVPPLAAVVERLRQERLADFKTDKKSHWSLTFDDKSQNGDLPAWPKITNQHKKPVLNNDPDRFNEKTVTPLVGDITVAQIDDVANQIKTGGSVQFDTAIMSILRKAEQENRELNDDEQATVAHLKLTRTQYLLKNG